MNEQNISPIKNIMKNELANKSKKLFLKSAKPFNNLQVSSQFRVCNRRYFEQQEEPKKINHKNINNIKTNNFFLMNNVPKNYVSISQEKTQKNQKIHEENVKKLKELEKLLDDLEKKNISLSNDIDQLKNEEDTLKNDLKNKEDEEKELNTELDNLKNINEEKNREYSQLMNQNIQQQSERHNNNNHNNNNHNNNDSNSRARENNNIQNNNSENQISINDLLNRVLRMQRNVIRENNQEEINNNNSNQQSINNSILEDNPELGENFGPPMTFAQIDALPSEKYPKRDTYDEKCVICGFNLFYNDSITKLVQCQHIFHKECLGNLLMRKQGSKCPICKVSLI